MIFNANGNTSSVSNVAASPYKLGLEGALMHVYETECNYNAMMKAVGLSEMKYFSETGKDLFMNEAGAFGGFIERAKALFKKIVEKIKAIFKTFMAKINSFAMKDKDFVKKYEKDILRKNITDLEFTGYEKMKNGFSRSSIETKFTELDVNQAVTSNRYGGEKAKDSDIVDDAIEKNRAAYVGQTGQMTESELRDFIKETLYGDKETFDVDSAMVRTAMETIRNTSKTVTEIEKEQKKIVDNIEKYIKSLDKAATAYNSAITKDHKDSTGAETTNAQADEVLKNVDADIRIAKAQSSDATIVFGAMCGAAKDANRQAKALCVKVLSYNKKESANVSESAASDDIFGGVNFA